MMEPYFIKIELMSLLTSATVSLPFTMITLPLDTPDGSKQKN
jgi:hypothetical protein